MSIEVMKQALEALELMYACYAHPEWISHKQQEEKILAQCVATTMTLRQAIANEALDKKAENARELGLDYEPVQAEKQVCVGCEGNPQGENIPCAVCGATPQPQQAEKQRHEFVCGECVKCGASIEKREWVGLTQEDIDIAFDDTQEGGGFNEFARAIEQTLRSKNS
jgi:hypothetical protein